MTLDPRWWHKNPLRPVSCRDWSMMPLDPEPLEPADLTKLLRGIQGDEALLKRLIHSFLADVPNRREALRRAVEAKDAAALERAAHALRGSVTVFGANETSALLRDLEARGRGGSLGDLAPALEALEAELRRLCDFLTERASG